MDPESILKECRLPAMPHVASKIMSLVNDPKSKVEDIQGVIASDQALTLRVLKVSSSVFHTGGRPVETIGDAVVVLGFEALKNIAIAIATKEIYKGSGSLGEKLWEHAIGVSIAAGLIGKKQKNFKVKADTCVVGGLLHDIGKAVLNQNKPKEYFDVDMYVGLEKRPYWELEKKIFGFTHQEVGALLFEKWKFSQELTEMVRNHHNCEVIKTDEKTSALCNIIRLADCICQRLGVGYAEPLPELCRDYTEKVQFFKLSGDDMSEIINDFKKKFIEEKLAFMS